MSDVIVLGGGYAGLAAALRLGERKIETVVLEAAGEPGGLGGAAMVAGIPLEHFYHHIKPEDVHILALIEQLGLADRLRWVSTRMGFLSNGHIYPFSGPLDLLTFAPFSLLDRARFAIGVVRAKRSDASKLVGEDAESWIVRTWGRSIYDGMMRPMLLNKFGIEPCEISAAFLQGRIKGLSSSKSAYKGGEKFAYLEGSNEELTRRLVAKVSEVAKIHTNVRALRISRRGSGFAVATNAGEFTARRIVNTLALTALERIALDTPFTHSVRYQGAINGIFVVREQLTPLYWINILDPEISFRVLVNQSALGTYPHTVLYCGNYVAPHSDFFAQSDAAIAARYRADLEQIFGPLTVLDHAVFRTPVATPVFDKDFARRVHDLDERIPGMVFAGNIKIYPGTRTLSSVFRTGVEAGERLASELAGPVRQAA